MELGYQIKDKDIIYEKIREAFIEIATLKLEHAQLQEQHQQPAQHDEKNQGLHAEDEDIFDEN